MTCQTCMSCRMMTPWFCTADQHSRLYVRHEYASFELADVVCIASTVLQDLRTVESLRSKGVPLQRILNTTVHGRGGLLDQLAHEKRAAQSHGSRSDSERSVPRRMRTDSAYEGSPALSSPPGGRDSGGAQRAAAEDSCASPAQAISSTNLSFGSAESGALPVYAASVADSVTPSQAASSTYHSAAPSQACSVAESVQQQCADPGSIFHVLLGLEDFVPSSSSSCGSISVAPSEHSASGSAIAGTSDLRSGRLAPSASRDASATVLQARQPQERQWVGAPTEHKASEAGVRSFALLDIAEIDSEDEV